MKKRILCILLTLVLLLTAMPAAAASVPICFVAMNDTVPLSLKGGAEPYYTSGKLYIPCTALELNPNGVCGFFNVELNTYVMFNASETLIVDLEKETYTDKRDKEYPIDLAYRSGLLYLPASVVSHFGLSVTMLNSRSGYPIIRFTNGGQVYDDGTFVAQAENLINRAADEYARELESQHTGPDIQTETPIEEEPEPSGPVEVYLAFEGEAVSKKTLDSLAEHKIRGAFFLTEEQILQDRELVRAIYAAGHTIGLTVPTDAPDAVAALVKANDALDQVLFFRSVLAMLPSGLTAELDCFHFIEKPAPITLDDLLQNTQQPQLYVVSEGSLGVIASLVNSGATMLRLRETSF